jgi:hypothetical protein
VPLIIDILFLHVGFIIMAGERGRGCDCDRRNKSGFRGGYL